MRSCFQIFSSHTPGSVCCLRHQILLSTVSSLGITGTPLPWFHSQSYLTSMSFRVAWRVEASKVHQLITGVPQGSVLGPLPYFYSLLRVCIPEAYNRSMSDGSWYQQREAQSHSPEHSQTFTVPCWWNDLRSSGMQNPLQHSKDS